MSIEYIGESKITDALSGRTVERVYREGLELRIDTTDGHSIVLQADVNHKIHLKRTDVKIFVPQVSLFGRGG